MKLNRWLLPVMIPALLAAQGTSTGASSLKLPQHALAASLTDVGAVEKGRLEAFGLNPATLSTESEATTVAFTHMAWIQDVSGQRLALSFPTSFGRFLASTAVSRIPNIEVRESPGPAISTFSAQSASFQAGWAGSIFRGISAGIAASYLYEKLYLNESTGFSVDAGVMAETPVPDLVLGVSAVNLGGMSAFRMESIDLPSTLRVAVGYRMTFGHFEARPAAAFRTGLNHDDAGVSIGGTLMYENLVGIRASWRSGDTAREVALGMSAGYRGIGIEYALVPFSFGLGTAQVITVGLTF